MSFNNTDPFSRSYTNNVFPGKVDLTDPDVLLQLAQDHGGAVAEAANELMHPKTSILSTVSDGFKSAFSGFIDTIQKPSEVVAGILSDKYSVSDTIKNHIKVSDVLFGTPSKGDGFSAGAIKWAGRICENNTQKIFCRLHTITKGRILTKAVQFINQRGKRFF